MEKFPTKTGFDIHKKHDLNTWTPWLVNYLAHEIQRKEMPLTQDHEATEATSDSYNIKGSHLEEVQHHPS